MSLPRAWSRAIALSFGLAWLAGAGTAAHALDPYPGETREAFAARAALEQPHKAADADTVAQVLAGGFAGGSGDGSSDILQYGVFGLGALGLGALRFSRGIFRVSRTVTRIGAKPDAGGSFEDRLADKLRELEPATPPPPPAIVSPPPPTPPAAPAPGSRTFGRRGA